MVKPARRVGEDLHLHIHARGKRLVVGSVAHDLDVRAPLRILDAAVEARPGSDLALVEGVDGLVEAALAVAVVDLHAGLAGGNVKRRLAGRRDRQQGDASGQTDERRRNRFRPEGARR
jgi:hypothetical protein